MASYYPSFNYMGINSRDKNLVVASFDADQGEFDTFLGMEPIYTESADGTMRIDYGAKYNNVATIRISIIKQDGGDFSVAEVRDTLKWLTGVRKNSPLDLAEHFLEEFRSDGDTTDFELINKCHRVYYVNVNNIRLSQDEWTFDSATNAIKLLYAPEEGATIKVAYNRIKYSFIGRVTNAWQQKMDARTVGIILEFTSVSPWAYSPVQTISHSVEGEANISIDCQSDDLYSYVYANAIYTNTSGDSLTITNNTTGDVTTVTDLVINELITITDKMLIVSDKPTKTFGNSFNFVFPRLSPGVNELTIEGTGTITFEYIVPLKVGDCAMDISVISDPICNDDGEIVLDTLAWSRIVNTPTTLGGYGITNAYTQNEVDKKITDATAQISWSRIINRPTTIASYGIINAYTKNEVDEKIAELDDTVYNKDEVNAKIDGIYDEVYTKTEVEEKIKSLILSEDDDVEIETITWQQVTNTPESLGGYGITNAYTKTEVNEQFENVYTKAEVDEKLAAVEVDIDEAELIDMLTQVLA